MAVIERRDFPTNFVIQVIPQGEIATTVVLEKEPCSTKAGLSFGVIVEV
jgi:hypothetical protein